MSQTPPIITGLYRNTEGAAPVRPERILAEIPLSLQINKWYAREMLFLAGDDESARELESFGLHPYRVFSDAPAHIQQQAVHRMKHWMCYWALQTFGEVLWVDWDTINLRPLDQAFWDWCRAFSTPKFVYIPDYWATVNCSVYYIPASWSQQMLKSFEIVADPPNDELLWTGVLPSNIRNFPEFWWKDRVYNIWIPEELDQITNNTYFLHVRELNYVHLLQRAPVDE